MQRQLYSNGGTWLHMDQNLVLAVDIGTSSVHAVGMERYGSRFAEKKRPCETRSPRTDFEEQDPDDIKGRVLKSVADCFCLYGDWKAFVRGMFSLYPLYKVAWLKRIQPELFGRTAGEDSTERAIIPDSKKSKASPERYVMFCSLVEIVIHLINSIIGNRK